MAQIFISHSSKDNDAAARLLAWLRERGFDQVFLDFDKDAGIQPGADWERTLYEQLERCQAVIIILTKNWHASKWCFAEYFAARAQGKAIFPIVESPTGEMLVGSDLQAINFVSDRSDGLERLSASLSEIALESAAGFELPDNVSPFPGLNSFEEHHAAVFFGRDDVLTQLREVLRKRSTQGGERLIALLGASGSGKSSLLRAGLIPRLRRDRDNWIVLSVFRPEYDPTAKLIDALLQLCGDDERIGAWEAALDGGNPEDALGQIARLVRRTSKAPDARILVAIDQGEELFLNLDEKARHRFFALLSKMLALQLPFVAVIAMRSEFLDALQVEKGRTVAFDTFSVEPVPLSRIGAIVRSPARYAGIRVDDELIAAVTQDAGRPDAMPLVAFALRELFDRFGGSGSFTLRDYETLGRRDSGITPLENAVRLVVEEAFPKAKRSDEDDRLLRETFVPALVQVNKEGNFARRSARYADLPERVRPFADKLIDARLLVRRGGGAGTGESIVEVSHEAVFRVWPELAAWLDEERDFLVGRDRLQDAATDWEELDRDDKALLRGVLLERAQDWLSNNPDRFSGTELEFVQASIDQDRAQRARKKRAERRLFAGVAAAAVVFAILAAWGKISSDRAIRAEAETQTQLRQTLKNQSLHLASLSEQRSDLGDPVTGALLALAALPGDVDGFARPYEPKAESALYRAVREQREMRVMRGHTKRVYTATFSRDGHVFATGSGDRTVRLWDAKTGGLLKTFEGHGKAITSVTFSADATRLYTGSLDETIRIWDTATGQVIRTLEAQSGAKCAVRSLVVNREESRIAAGCGDSTIRIWDIDTGRPVFEFDRHNGAVTAIAFSPDGANLVSASRDGTMLLWAIPAGTALAFEPTHRDSVKSVAFSTDGRRVISGSTDKTAIIWEVASRAPLHILEGHENAVEAVALDASGTRAVTGSVDRSLRLWNARTGEVIAVLRGHGAAVRTVAFSPTGERIVSGSSDFTARLWDARPAKHLGALLEGHTDAVNQADFNDDGTRMVTASRDGTARVWNAMNGELLATFEHGEFDVKSAAFDADGSRIVTGAGDGKVRIWSPGQSSPLLTTGGQAGQILSTVFSGDGQRVLAGANDGTARVWNARTGAQVLVLADHGDAVMSVAFDADSNRIATGGLGGALRIWNATSGKIIHRMDVEGADVRSVSFSPDGRLLAAGFSDQTVRLFDTATGVPAMPNLLGHRNEVTSVRFQSDNNRVVSGSSDGTMRIWSTTGPDAGEILEIQSDEGPVSSIAVTRGGGGNIAVAAGNLVAVWRSFKSTQDLIDHARSALPRCPTPDERRRYVIPAGALAWCAE